MEIRQELISQLENEYGDNYNSHILEIYKLYVDMADKISARRQTANSYFLSINTAIIAFYSFAQIKKSSPDILPNYIWIIGIAGIILCYTWYRLIRSYKDLNFGKFKVIHEIEKYLPISPYDAEWAAIGRGENPKLYLQFTKIEMRIPFVFMLLHLLIILFFCPFF